MTANAAAKKAIRAFAKYEGINYTEARTRLEKARDCWHLMTLGTDYDGSEAEDVKQSETRLVTRSV